MVHYDIVLVLDYFRTATAYLSVVKYLSARYRIGLYVTPGDPLLMRKNAAAHRAFVEQCLALGARFVEESEVAADLLLVQQRVYQQGVPEEVLRRVSAPRRSALMNLAMAGLSAHDAFLTQFGIGRVYVPSRRFFEFLLRERQAERTYAGLDVVEVGLPFAKYPVFPEFQADYLIAAPTMFSFKSERAKIAFLEDVLSLLRQIGHTDKVVYKPHNGAGKDYFAPAGYTALGRATEAIPGASAVLRRLARRMKGRPKTVLERSYVALLYARMLRRVVPIGDEADAAYVALEAFLPGVRKGVIGGLSNTIWGTLYFGLTFYNCVDSDGRGATDRQLLAHKSSDHLLDLNLRFFGVPYCAARLGGGAAPSDVVTEADRRGDLIRALEGELGKVGCGR